MQLLDECAASSRPPRRRRCSSSSTATAPTFSRLAIQRVSARKSQRGSNRRTTWRSRGSMRNTLRNAYDNSYAVTRTIFSPRRSPSCADCGKPPRRCSTAPTTARTFWTTNANASCTPRPPRPPISSTWASLAWFSDAYRRNFPAKAAAAGINETAPATTHALFHTMADMASIRGRFVDPTVSLVNPGYDRKRPRRYLNDHNEAVPFRKNRSRTGGHGGFSPVSEHQTLGKFTARMKPTKASPLEDSLCCVIASV